MFKITLFLVLATYTYFGADAIKCYNCNTGTNSKCADPDTKETPSVECTATTIPIDLKNNLVKNDTLPRAEDFVCYNMKTTMSDVSLVIRGCMASNIAGEFCKSYEESLPGGKVDYCGTCTSDLCNSAKGLHIHLYTSIVCVFAALFVSKLL